MPNVDPSRPAFLQDFPTLAAAISELQPIQQALNLSVGAVDSHSRTSGAADSAGPIVRAFFWGFHIEIPHADLQAFMTDTAPLVKWIEENLPLFAAAAVFVGPLIGFLLAFRAILGSVDKGKGIYLSMLWIAPGIFIPTTVL